MDVVQGAGGTAPGTRKGVAARPRSGSPQGEAPKAKVVAELSATIALATASGASAGLLQQAQARLSEAEAARLAQRAKQAEAAKKRPGEKDEKDELAKMERKMAKKMGMR